MSQCNKVDFFCQLPFFETLGNTKVDVKNREISCQWVIAFRTVENIPNFFHLLMFFLFIFKFPRFRQETSSQNHYEGH